VKALWHTVFTLFLTKHPIPMRLIPSLLLLILLCGCESLDFKKKDDRAAQLDELLQTDADFAETAREQGYRKAFMEFMDDDAVLLRDNYLPIIGGDAVRYVNSMNDTTFTVDWSPQAGDVSSAGDLGFTYGVYELRTDTERQTGTYVTVWRRNKEGRWRYVLDAGTQGTGETE
jgi:ketosteroid isomerase-like protein